MNKSENGIPIFKIIKKTKTGVKEIDEVYVDSNNPEFNSIKLNENEHTQLIPSNRERDVLYITGSSGSGKSYFALQFLHQYHLKYKKNPVYLFSSLTEDATLDKFKPLKRVNINTPEFLNEEFNINDFADSCIIFDDTDCIRYKPLHNKIQGLLNIILETGRHSRTTCIYTSHLPSKGMETKRILNEAHSITFFTAGLGNVSLKYLMEQQMGLDQKQRKAIKCNKSRASTFIKTFPNLILYDKGCYVLNDETD
jgi:hypothetical protein